MYFMILDTGDTVTLICRPMPMQYLHIMGLSYANREKENKQQWFRFGKTRYQAKEMVGLPIKVETKTPGDFLIRILKILQI